jgi:hypothetical protein
MSSLPQHKDPRYMGPIYAMESPLGKLPPKEKEVIILNLAYPHRLSKFAQSPQGQILQRRLWGEMEEILIQRGSSPLEI